MEKIETSSNIKKDLTDVLIRVGIIGFLVFISYKIFAPFMSIMLWALILAVILFPLHQLLANKLGGSQGRSATIIVLCGILFLGVPAVMFSGSLVDFIQQAHTKYSGESISINAPEQSVAQWPVVGKKVYAIWEQASKDLPKLLKKFKPQIEEFAKSALSFAAGMAGSLFQSLFALVLAGIMMAYGHGGSDSILKILNRFAGGERGASLHKLSTATIRSVALGVVGVSVIQALIFGIGFIFIDMPAGAIIALIMVIFGIAQIPAILFTIPTVAYIWYSGDSSAMNIVFTIYFVIGGFVDNALKPILLGRGVDAPMPVVLIGALGGMVTMGLIGLFIGATFLSLAYVVFMKWVDDEQDVEQTSLT